jgi:methyl-accepting chemotaxis protein
MPRSNLNFEDRMLKMMSDMSDRMVGEVNGRVGEITHIVGEMNGRMGEISQTVNSHSQSIAKLETQVGQMANTSTKGKKGSFQVSQWLIVRGFTW